MKINLSKKYIKESDEVEAVNIAHEKWVSIGPDVYIRDITRTCLIQYPQTQLQSFEVYPKEKKELKLNFNKNLIGKIKRLCKRCLKLI